jgi:hypothetical protein
MSRVFSVLACLVAFVSVPAVSTAQELTVDPYIQSQLDAIEAELFPDVYEMELEVDSATWEDHDLMEELLLTLPDGPAPRNFRKLIAGVVGEFRLALGGRVNGDALTLDDGSVVLATAKKKKAKKKHPKRAHGASIQFDKDGRGQPELIVIRAGDCVRVLQFPLGEDAGAPKIHSKCAVK